MRVIPLLALPAVLMATLWSFAQAQNLVNNDATGTATLCRHGDYHACS